jgi:hypothetical protein
VRSGGQPNGGNSSEAKDVSGGQRRGAPAVGVLGGLTRKYAERCFDTMTVNQQRAVLVF